MTFSRRVGLVSILGASWFVAVACADDSPKIVAAASGEAGEGGEGPSGGKSSLGGSANNPSNGGTGENGGGEGGAAAGTAGTSTAGTGGTSTGGSGGTSTGGTGTGQSGGEAGGGAVSAVGGASAGAGGNGVAGEGGVPAVAIVKSCGNDCEIDDDCKIGTSTNLKCDNGSHRCYDSTVVACTTNLDCAPSGMGWDLTCDTDDSCAGEPGTACVTVGALGYCATLSAGDACDFGKPQDVARHGATGVMNVCVPYDTCQDGACNFNCGDPLFGGFCDAGNGASCNDETGRCECTLGDECSSGVCGADHQCVQCAVDEDCLGSEIAGWDVCVDGKCGCSSTDVCPDLTQAATPVCE